MERMAKRYFQLKLQQKEIENELSALRSTLIGELQNQGVTECTAGSYQVKMTTQERKEYDDNKLYAALPDPGLWRMLSKADGSKIAGLIKLNVLSDVTVAGTYQVKNIQLLHVSKQ